jgi:hypothetical protein
MPRGRKTAPFLGPENGTILGTTLNSIVFYNTSRACGGHGFGQAALFLGPPGGTTNGAVFLSQSYSFSVPQLHKFGISCWAAV